MGSFRTIGKEETDIHQQIGQDFLQEAPKTQMVQPVPNYPKLLPCFHSHVRNPLPVRAAPWKGKIDKPAMHKQFIVNDKPATHKQFIVNPNMIKQIN